MPMNEKLSLEKLAGLHAALDQTVAERFVHSEHREMVVVDNTPAALLDRFRDYRSPRVEKWLERIRTGQIAPPEE